MHKQSTRRVLSFLQYTLTKLIAKPLVVAIWLITIFFFILFFGLSNAAEGKKALCPGWNRDRLARIEPRALLDSVIAGINEVSLLASCYDTLYKELYFPVEAHRFDYYTSCVGPLLFRGHLEKAELLLKDFKELASGSDNQHYKGSYWFAEGNYYMVKSQWENAEAAFQKAAGYFSKLDHKGALYMINGNLSTVYLNSKKYDAAYQYLLLGQNLADTHEGLISDKQGLIGLNNIGVTYLRRGITEQADSIFREVQERAEFIEEGAYPLALSLLNRMEVAVVEEDWGEFAILHAKVRPYLAEFKYFFSWYTKVAFNYYLGIADYVKAWEMIDNLSKYEQDEAVFPTLDCQKMRIRYHLAFNQGSEALPLIQQAETHPDVDLEIQVELSRYRLKAFMVSGDENSALTETKRLEKLYNRYEKEQQQLRKEEMAAIYELESLKAAQNRSEKLAQEADERASLLIRNRLYLGIALLLALVALLVLGLLFRSEKQLVLQEQKRAHAAEMHSKQVDKQLKVQRQAGLQRGIGAAQLKHQIMGAIERYGLNTSMLKGKFSLLLDEFSEQSDFVELFLLSHPDFFKALAERAPDLTHSQLRYAILIALRASSAEIAATLGVGEAAVKMAHYRLKSKLGLEEDIILEQYLQQLLLQ